MWKCKPGTVSDQPDFREAKFIFISACHLPTSAVVSFWEFFDLYTHIHIPMLQLHLTVSDGEMSWIIYRRNNLWLDWDWWVFIKLEQGVPSRIVNYRDAVQICDIKNDNQRSTPGYNHTKRSPRCVVEGNCLSFGLLIHPICCKEAPYFVLAA